MRKKIIIGNWKMNGSISHLESFYQEVKPHINKEVEAGLALPFTLISLLKSISDGDIIISAQNINENDSGAYTGEVSADMLIEAGASATIIGHSERRAYYFESDESVNLKAKKALEKALMPVICLGESLEEREEHLHEKKVETQLRAALNGIDEAYIDKLLIAYEPIWAIGTGKTASSDDAEAMAKHIREVVRSLYPAKADDLRILYGGSVKPSNIGELMAKENIDGALVGGASLKASDFISLINF